MCELNHLLAARVLFTSLKDVILRVYSEVSASSSQTVHHELMSIGFLFEDKENVLLNLYQSVIYS